MTYLRKNITRAFLATSLTLTTLPAGSGIIPYDEMDIPESKINPVDINITSAHIGLYCLIKSTSPNNFDSCLKSSFLALASLENEDIGVLKDRALLQISENENTFHEGREIPRSYTSKCQQDATNKIDISTNHFELSSNIVQHSQCLGKALIKWVHTI